MLFPKHTQMTHDAVYQSSMIFRWDLYDSEEM